jgi:hypothetical protein
MSWHWDYLGGRRCAAPAAGWNLRALRKYDRLKAGVTALRRLHSAAVYVALLALVLRALVPAGWMPSAAAASPITLIPCPMMDGMGGMPEPQPQLPAKHQLPLSHEGSICPFATPAQPVRAIQPHPIEIAPARFAFFGPMVGFFASDWDHVPRAPPSLA